MMNKKQFKMACLILVLLFLVIYMARVFYELRNFQNEIPFISSSLSNNAFELKSIRNYASLKMDYSKAGSSISQIVDQKYERVATISSCTTLFSDDETKLNEAIEKNKGVVQFENKQGLISNRRIDMVIGVKPDYFDVAVKDISAIGEILSTTVSKTDKTTEYKQMLADKATLEKTKDSYISLREKGGTVTELLALEEKIIEIERLIQNKSVELGEYNDDNAFCTINFALQEKTGAKQYKNVMGTLWSSLQWTVRCYFTTVGTLLGILIATFILLLLYKYGRKIITDIKKPDKSNTNKEE